MFPGIKLRMPTIQYNIVPEVLASSVRQEQKDEREREGERNTDRKI